MISRTISAAIAIVAFSSVLVGAWTDNFSSGAGSWVTTSGTTLDSTTQNGVFHIVNTSAVYLAMYKYSGTQSSMVSSSTRFTFSADIKFIGKANSVMAGIGFCGSGTLSYGFGIDVNGRFQLYKWITSGASATAQTLCFLPNSAINPLNSRITVVKADSLISLYCNERFLAAINDKSYSSGYICLLIPPNDTIEFDNVAFDATVSTFPRFSCFTDSFPSGDLSNWFRKDNGANVSITGSAGQMAITSPNVSPNQQAMPYVNGQFEKCHLKTIISQPSGDETEPYGPCFIQISQNSNMSYTFKTLAFFMNNWGLVDIKLPDSTSISLSDPVTANALHCNGLRDTLEVVRDTAQGEYQFLGNGKLLRKCDFPANFVPNAIGMQVGKNVTINCYLFRASENRDFSCPVEPPTAFRFTVVRNDIPGFAPGVVFDPLGRRIIRYAGIMAQMQTMPQGAYVIVPVDKSRAAMKIMPMR